MCNTIYFNLFYFILVLKKLLVDRMAKIKRFIITSKSKDVEKLKPLHIVGENVKQCRYCGRYSSSSIKHRITVGPSNSTEYIIQKN